MIDSQLLLYVNDGKIVDVTVCPGHDDATPAGKCNLPKIDVRAVEISEPIPVYHLFIIYTDENGINYLFRGGPSGSFTGAKFTKSTIVPNIPE